MRKHTFNALILVAAMAASPAVFAQEASQYRWNATIGAAVSVPKSNPGSILGNEAHVDGGTAGTISGTWFFHDNFAVELWGAVSKFDQDIDLANGVHGSFKQQPIAISAQYFFGHASMPIRPYVGLGYYQANIDDEHFDPITTPFSVNPHVGLGTPRGAIITGGVDFNITDRWFTRADVRYMHGDSDVTFDGIGTDSALDLNPWVVGVAVGARF
jgi:outer membrane protein